MKIIEATRKFDWCLAGEVTGFTVSQDGVAVVTDLADNASEWTAVFGIYHITLLGS